MSQAERNGFPYFEQLVELKLDTHLPTKWLAVDLETGDVWRGTPQGKWKRYPKETAENGWNQKGQVG